MSQAFLGALAVDLAPHVNALTAAASGIAQRRAADISTLSSGAVTATTEQMGAIESKAVEELFDQLRERIRDVARVYAHSITQQNPEA